jgi:hypothetical protein
MIMIVRFTFQKKNEKMGLNEKGVVQQVREAIFSLEIVEKGG